MKRWPPLAAATVERLADLAIEARSDPRELGHATFYLYFNDRRVGAIDAEADGAVVKIVSWPGLSLERMAVVRITSVADLPKLRASLIARLPLGFEESISSVGTRLEKAAREFAGRPRVEVAAIAPVDEETRLAWEQNRQQAAFWKGRPQLVTTVSDQTESVSRPLYCARCHVQTTHVLTGQKSTARGKDWQGWRCTLCSVQKQIPSH